VGFLRLSGIPRTGPKKSGPCEGFWVGDGKSGLGTQGGEKEKKRTKKKQRGGKFTRVTVGQQNQKKAGVFL